MATGMPSRVPVEDFSFRIRGLQERARDSVQGGAKEGRGDC
jgi:hypothetical protein